MSIFIEDFSTGTVGQPVAGAWNYVTPGGFVYGNADVLYKTRTADLTNPGSSAFEFWKTLSDATGPVAIDYLFQYSAPPSTGDIWTSAFYHDSNTWAFRTPVTSGNKLKLDTKGTAASGTNRWTSSTTMNPGSFYRLALWIDPGTTTSNGSIEGQFFEGLSSTPAETLPTISGIDLGAVNALAQAHFGKLNTTVFNGTLRFNYIRIRTGADATKNYAPLALPPAASIYPVSVISNAGNWVKSSSASSIVAALNDNDPSTWIENPSLAAGEEIILQLGNNLQSGDVKIEVGYRRPVGETAGQVTAKLLQGPNNTVIKTVVTGTTSGAPSASAMENTVDQTASISLSSAENAAITDRTNLRVSLALS